MKLLRGLAALALSVGFCMFSRGRLDQLRNLAQLLMTRPRSDRLICRTILLDGEQPRYKVSMGSEHRIQQCLLQTRRAHRLLVGRPRHRQQHADGGDIPHVSGRRRKRNPQHAEGKKPHHARIRGEIRRRIDLGVGRLERQDDGKGAMQRLQ